jgi:uncharacterized small protein (DUF1192 family)
METGNDLLLAVRELSNRVNNLETSMRRNYEDIEYSLHNIDRELGNRIGYLEDRIRRVEK